MRWTRACRARCLRDERCGCGRRSRVVLAPRCWRQVGGRDTADDGGKKARSPGRSRISRKPLRRGCRVASGVPVVPAPVLFYCTGGHGCIGHPAFPAPSLFREGGEESSNLARIGGETDEPCLVGDERRIATGCLTGESDVGRPCGRRARGEHPPRSGAHWIATVTYPLPADIIPQPCRGDVPNERLPTSLCSRGVPGSYRPMAHQDSRSRQARCV
jgi:hypothetical protein